MKASENIFGRPIPLLGFGCMRLPETQEGEYVEDECQAMFDFAMTHGMNYFDSAWHYIESQKMIGQCLSKYPRDSYMLVGKLCFHDGTLTSREDAEAAFQKELDDARTDYMDLELIHALGNPGSIERVDKLNIWGFMKELKASGRVKHIGFSFHSTPDNLDKLLTEHPEVEVVQIQANYYDHITPKSRQSGGCYEVYEVCRKHNKPIIIMEPIKGGNLAKVDRHSEIAELFHSADQSQTPVSWALRYAASLDGVLTVLSGMSSLKQMQENYHILMKGYTPLTAAEIDMLKQVGRILESKAPIGCTACRYCVDKGCPAGINIPKVLESLNMIQQYQDRAGANLTFFQSAMGDNGGPESCIRCSSCEKSCPQHLPIMDLMAKAGQEFDLDGVNVWANWQG